MADREIKDIVENGKQLLDDEILENVSGGINVRLDGSDNAHVGNTLGKKNIRGGSNINVKD